MRRLLSCFMVTILSVSLLNTNYVDAGSNQCITYEGTNIGTHNYSKWSAPINSYLYKCEDGRIMLVQYGSGNNGVLVQYYDEQYNLTSYKVINEELPIFGGFYGTADNYYIVSGQRNDSCSASVEVFRITKYDKNWNRLASVGLKDCNTTVPFDAGSLRMTDSGGYLLIRTAHEMYNGHQANVTIQVHMKDMKITAQYTDVMNTGYGYVSHSFNQFIKVENDKIIAVDHGDAYPRSVALLKYKTNVSSGSFIPSYYTQCEVIDVIQIPGAIGENATGLSIGGFEYSSSSYLIAGNSTIQDEKNTTYKTRNIYVASVDKNTNAISKNWITSYSEGNESVSTPKLVKVSNDKFLVMWSRNDYLYYKTVDGKGNSTSITHRAQGKMSDCDPIVVNNKILWHTWDDEEIKFYDINLQDLSDINITSTNNGHNYSVVSVVNGVSTIRCSVCGDTQTKNVATSFDAWWNVTDGSGYYYSGVDGKQEVGKKIYLWITGMDNVDKEVSVIVSDPQVLSWEWTSDNSMGIFTAKKPGNATVTISPKWNPNVKKSVVFNITGSGVFIDEAVDVNGYQISTTSDGVRIIYTVASKIGGKDVVERGLVYGLSGYASESDMCVDSTSKYVKNYKATNSGVFSNNAGVNPSTTYVMTMKKDIKNTTVEGLSAQYYVRAYAKLSDGSILYSEVTKYSVFDLSHYMYQNKIMNTTSKHEYLYNNVLKRVNKNYNK